MVAAQLNDPQSTLSDTLRATAHAIEESHISLRQMLALVGEQGKRASPLPGLGRPLHLVYRPSSLKRDRIARLVQALQAHFRHLSSQG